MKNRNWKEFIKRAYFACWFIFSTLGIASALNYAWGHPKVYLDAFAAAMAFVIGPAIIYFIAKYVWAGFEKKSS